MGLLAPADAESYRDQLLAMLPRGAAWTRETGQRLVELLHGLAFELARVHTRVGVLFDEADPRVTSEMLDAWERNFGLPDSPPLYPIPTTTAGRRRMLHARVTAQGGQTADYLEDVATAAGGTNVVITELWTEAWRVDSSACDEPITGEGVVYTFEVAGNHNTFDDEIKAAVDTYKPAHTHAIYDLVP